MTKHTGVVGLLAVLAGCGGGGHMQLDTLRESKVPVWYLGSSFEGHELTYADFDGVPERVLVVYGDCDPPGASSPTAAAFRRSSSRLAPVRTLS